MSIHRTFGKDLHIDFTFFLDSAVWAWRARRTSLAVGEPVMLLSCTNCVLGGVFSTPAVLTISTSSLADVAMGCVLARGRYGVKFSTVLTSSLSDLLMRRVLARRGVDDILLTFCYRILLSFSNL